MKATIYAIRHLYNNQIYIGSTIEKNIKVRLSKHKYDSRFESRAKPFHKIVNDTGGWSQYYISVIKELNCDSIEELRCHENKIISDYKCNPQYHILNYNNIY